jgi:hypothetical protein
MIQTQWSGFRSGDAVVVSGRLGHVSPSPLGEIPTDYVPVDIPTDYVPVVYEDEPGTVACVHPDDVDIAPQ